MPCSSLLRCLLKPAVLLWHNPFPIGPPRSLHTLHSIHVDLHPDRSGNLYHYGLSWCFIDLVVLESALIDRGGSDLVAGQNIKYMVGKNERSKSPSTIARGRQAAMMVNQQYLLVTCVISLGNRPEHLLMDGTASHDDRVLASSIQPSGLHHLALHYTLCGMEKIATLRQSCSTPYLGCRATNYLLTIHCCSTSILKLISVGHASPHI